MKTNLILLLMLVIGINQLRASELTSIQKFDVKPGNSAALNKINLQKAIDWATVRGAALFVEPSEEPYPINGGIILKKNVSLIGVHGPTTRGTTHATKNNLLAVCSPLRIEKMLL